MYTFLARSRAKIQSREKISAEFVIPSFEIGLQIPYVISALKHKFLPPSPHFPFSAKYIECLFAGRKSVMVEEFPFEI